jgi:hypothetical protein
MRLPAWPKTKAGRPTADGIAPARRDVQASGFRDTRSVFGRTHEASHPVWYPDKTWEHTPLARRHQPRGAQRHQSVRREIDRWGAFVALGNATRPRKRGAIAWPGDNVTRSSRALVKIVAFDARRPQGSSPSGRTTPPIPRLSPCVGAAASSAPAPQGRPCAAVNRIQDEARVAGPSGQRPGPASRRGGTAGP